MRFSYGYDCIVVREDLLEARRVLFASILRVDYRVRILVFFAMAFLGEKLSRRIRVLVKKY